MRSQERITHMKFHEILMGGMVEVISGAVFSQFFNVALAVVLGIISGISVAFAARSSESHGSDD